MSARRHPPPAPTARSTSPPVIDPLFGRHWPDAPGSGRPVVLAALGVGVLAGLLIPYRDLGPRVLPGAARRRRHRAGGRRSTGRDPFTVDLPGAGGPVHVCRCVLLDAEWIVALCLVAGTGLPAWSG